MENHALQELLEKKALRPVDRQEAVDRLVEEQRLPAARACRLMNVSRSGWYRGSPDPAERDGPVIARLNEVVAKHGRWGFWKCFHWMRQRGETWNHKRVLRVYRSMQLNLPRRAKRRLPARLHQPLEVPAQPERM